MFYSGTLTTLVATGVSVGGAQLRCSDLTTTASVNDGDMVQPYFAISSNSIIIAIGTNQLPFTLSIPPEATGLHRFLQSVAPITSLSLL